jgi:heme-degrading monooxygenase HmoA
VRDPFVYLWAYRVSPGRLNAFLELYGPNGSWADLFRRAPGYLGTQLLQDRIQSDRFITVDRWVSEEAFVSFRRRFAEDFDHLDRLGETLTAEETALGEFRPLGET